MNRYIAAVLAVAAGAGVWLARRKQPAMAASALLVSTDDAGIALLAADGERKAVAWQDLTQVALRTTDEGPFATDVFWLFHAGAGDPALVVPGGAAGEAEMLQVLGTRLPGFRHEAVIEAMGSTANALFVVWQPADTGPAAP